VVDIAGVHNVLMRRDNVVKPARGTGGFIKGICVSKILALSLRQKPSLAHPLSLEAQE